MKKAVFWGKFAFWGMCLVFLAAGCLPARADAMWEPQNDAFCKAHDRECLDVSGRYEANGAGGYITAWESPDSDVKIASYLNGNRFTIYRVYIDGNGEQWGLSSLTKSEEHAISFWIPMKDLATDCNAQSFWLDHYGELQPYRDELDGYEEKAAVLLWTYPGSGRMKNQVSDKGKLFFSGVYTDTDGRQWGYDPNYGAWVCLSAPDNDALPVSEAAPVRKIPAAMALVTFFTNGLFWAAAAVIAAAVAAAVLIRRFCKKKKAAPGIPGKPPGGGEPDAS